MADGSVIIDTGLDKSKINSQMASIKGTLSSGFKAVAKSGAVALGAITAGVVAFGISAEKAFVGFETSMAKVSTLFGDVAVDTESLNAKMLALSDSSGLASEALGESLYSALSAGIPVTEDMGEAMAFLESNTKLAKAGFTDVDTAVSTTAKILNAYNLDVSETDRIHKILMQTQNKGITTVGELGQSLALVTPTAAAFGVSFDNVGASLATMTAQGTPTSQAVTQLNGTIAELGKQGTIASDNLKLAAQAAGLSETSFKGMMESGMSLGDVIKVMGDYAEANNLSMVDMFSSIEAGKGALSLSGANLETFNDNLKAVGTTTDVVGDAYAKMDATIGEQSNKIKNTVKNLGISIMADNRGALADMVSFANDALSNISQAYGEGGFSGAIKQAVKEAVSGITTLISDGLPKMIGFGSDILMSLAEGIYNAMPNMIYSVAYVMGQIVGTIIRIFPNVVSTGSDIVANLITGISNFIPKAYDKALEIITGFAESLRSGETNITEAGSKILNALIEGIFIVLPALWEFVKGLIPEVVSIISSLLGSVITVGGDIITKLWDGLKERWPSIVEWARTLIGNIVDTINEKLPDLLTVGFGIVTSIINGLANAIPNLLNKATEIIQNFSDSLRGGDGQMSDSGKAILTALITGIESVLSSLWDLVKSIVPAVVSLITASLESLFILGKDIVLKLIDGLNENWPQIKEWATTLITNIKDNIAEGVVNIYSSAKEIADYFLGGFVDGIKEKYEGAKKAIGGVFQGILDFVKHDKLDEHSNSKESKRYGEWFMGGFSDGIEDGKKGVIKSMEVVAEDATDAFSDTVKEGAVKGAEAGTEVAKTTAKAISSPSIWTTALNSIKAGWDDALKSMKQKASDWAGTLSSIMNTAFNAVGDSLSALGEALVSGEDGWKAFAKAGLLALSDILRAIGNQLAAMAVVEAIKWNFVGAGEAVAGATAAYIASGAVKEWANSYAVGTMALPKDGLYYGHEGETIIPKGITAEAKQAGVVIASRQSIAQGGGMQKLKANITAVFKGNIEMDGTEVARIVFQHTDQNVGLAY